MKLKDYLKTNNIKLATFARETNINISLIFKYANNQIKPKLSNLKKIEEATGGIVSFSDFLEGEK